MEFRVTDIQNTLSLHVKTAIIRGNYVVYLKSIRSGFLGDNNPYQRVTAASTSLAAVFIAPPPESSMSVHPFCRPLS